MKVWAMPVGQEVMPTIFRPAAGAGAAVGAGALARALGVADSDWTFASTPLRDEPVGDPAACRQALIDALARAPRPGRPAEEMR